MTRDAYKKHKKLIDIWATGTPIEMETYSGDVTMWEDVPNDHKFHENTVYREKHHRWIYTINGHIRITKLSYVSEKELFAYLSSCHISEITVVGTTTKVEEVLNAMYEECKK